MTAAIHRSTKSRSLPPSGDDQSNSAPENTDAPEVAVKRDQQGPTAAFVSVGDDSAHEQESVQRFGKWTLVTEAGKDPRRRGERRVVVRCDCGYQRTIAFFKLSMGQSRSCGCSNRSGVGAIENRSWYRMLKRCFDPRDKAFHNYGARGITVCDRWRRSVVDFVADVGPRPSPGHSLERIDNDGNYEPGNVRWATNVEQQRNTRKTIRLSIDGVTKSSAEWAEKLGIRRDTVNSRLYRGWTAQQALGLVARHRGDGA